MRNCKTLARDCPRLFWAGLLVAVGIGLLCSSVLWEYRTTISPRLEKLSSVELLPRSDTNSYWFVAEYSTTIVSPCYRDNTYVLYRNESNNTKIYYVLASYPNGANIEDTSRYYKLQFFLPIGFPSGEWNYIVRTHYFCPPFELVSLHKTSMPIAINIPDKQDHN